MGTRGDGGGTGRARRAGPVVAAIAGATAVAAAAALTRRRRGAAPSPAGVAPGTTASEAGRRPSTARPSRTGTPPAGASRYPAGGAATTAAGVPIPHPLADPPTSGAPPSAPDPAAGTAAPGTVADRPPSGPASNRPGTVPPGAHRIGGTPAAGAGETAERWPAPAGVVTDDPASGDTSTGGPASSRAPRLPGGRRTGLAVAVAAVALVLGGGAIVAGSGGDGSGDDRTATASTGGTVATTATTLPPVTADNAFAAAAERLTTAGSFSYSGTVSATDVSNVRPMFWLAVSSTVEGQVATSSHRLQEVAATSDGAAAETVAVGESVWGRRGPSVEALAGLPFEPIPGLSGPRPGAGDPALVPPARGAALLPAWLAAATAASDVGPDEQGRLRFQATLPAAALGEIERQRPAVDATVVLTLDATGVPVRVEVTSAPDGPAMHLVYDIAGLGQPVTIEPPA